MSTNKCFRFTVFYGFTNDVLPQGRIFLACQNSFVLLSAQVVLQSESLGQGILFLKLFYLLANLELAYLLY